MAEAGSEQLLCHPRSDDLTSDQVRSMTYDTCAWALRASLHLGGLHVFEVCLLVAASEVLLGFSLPVLM
jgi:hypothetical protein